MGPTGSSGQQGPPGIQGPPGPRMETVPLYEYYRDSSASHYYTINPDGIGTTTPGAVGRYGFRYNGVACYVANGP